MGRTSKVFPTLVKIINVKIQEPMNNLIPKDEASSNVLPHADIAAFCALPGLLLIVLLKLFRRDNSAPSGTVSLPGFEKLRKETLYILMLPKYSF